MTDLTAVVVGAYAGAGLILVGGYIAMHLLRQLPWQQYAYLPFDPPPAVVAPVRSHRRPARYDLVSRLAPLAVLIDNCTAPMRGISA